MKKLFKSLVFLGLLAAPAIAQPAPPLTKLQITQVRSQTYQRWESVAPNALANSITAQGGTWFEVRVRTTGYDQGASATFGGRAAQRLSGTAILDSRRRVIGYEYVFRINLSRGATGGRWVITDTSLVFPYRTLIDAINVR